MRTVLIDLLLFLLAGLFNSSCASSQNVLFSCSGKLENPYGLTAHITIMDEKYGDFICRDSLLSLARNLGVSYIRYDFDPSWKNLWEDATESVINHGLLPYVILSKGKKNMRPWDNIFAYEKYLNDALWTHQKVEAWEIMNEADLVIDRVNDITNDVAAEGYTRIFPNIVKYLSEKSPDSKIVTGSICNWESPFVYSLFEKGCFEYSNVLNFHAYSAPENLIRGFNNMKAKMEKYNTYPHVWLTECGMPTHLDSLSNSTKQDIEDEQAKRVARIHILSFAYGVDKVFWYNLRSREGNAYDKEHHFGLLHKDLSPKPAYYAYKTMTSMIPSGSSRPILDMVGSSYCSHWILPNGKNGWAVWSKENHQQVKLRVTGTTKYYDYMGNRIRKPKEIGDGVIYIIGAKSVTFN